MQIRIGRDTFLKGLQKVLGVVERKSTMPILSNVLLEASGKTELSLTGTNLDVGAVGSYEANVVKPGKVTVDARHLHDIVREMADAELTLTGLDNHWVEISAGKARFKIAGLPADEFPALPEVEGAKAVEMPAQALVEMLERTSFSISTDETRYNMSGIHIEVSKDGGRNVLRMVSTDTHRLSLIDRELEKLPKLKAEGVIIPRKGVSELRKLAEEAGEDTLELGLSGTTAVARYGAYTLVMRLVEGQFPDYQQVIPKEHNKTLKIPRQDFVSILRRVSILSSDRIKGVKFEMGPRLVLSSSNPEFGEAREEFDAKYDGGELVIGFNAKYLLDALAVMTTDEVEFRLKDDSSPGVLVEPGNDDYTYVIMPMRI